MFTIKHLRNESLLFFGVPLVNAHPVQREEYLEKYAEIPGQAPAEARLSGFAFHSPAVFETHCGCSG